MAKSLGRLELWTADKTGDVIRWKFEGEFNHSHIASWLLRTLSEAQSQGRGSYWICQAGEDSQRPFAVAVQAKGPDSCDTLKSTV